MTVDRRLLPGEDSEDVKRQICAALGSIAADERAEYELVERARFVPTEVPPDTELVAVVQDATEAAIGRRAGIDGMGGSTDARVLIAEGIPTVTFGPGDASQAHTIDESVSVEDLRRGALSYAATFCQFLGPG